MFETQAAFARRLGKDKSHVTRLKQSGRLVMAAGRVDVEASMRLLAATESPLPHHTAQREALAAARTTELGPEALAEIGRRQKLAQAEKLENEAAVARIERERLEGRLAEVDAVRSAGADLGGVVRAIVERLPDRYAPEMAAAQSVEAARALLLEMAELVLEDVVRELDTLARRLGVEA